MFWAYNPVITFITGRYRDYNPNEIRVFSANLYGVIMIEKGAHLVRLNLVTSLRPNSSGRKVSRRSWV